MSGLSPSSSEQLHVVAIAGVSATCEDGEQLAELSQSPPRA